MTMTTTQAIITIAAAVLGTMVTRFLPFIIFTEGKNPPEYVKYLGTVLPYAVIGLLVVYCLKDVPGSGTYGIPEAIAILFIVLIHKWKKSTLLSIGSGTVQDHGKEPESRNGQGSGRYIQRLEIKQGGSRSGKSDFRLFSFSAVGRQIVQSAAHSQELPSFG